MVLYELMKMLEKESCPRCGSNMLPAKEPLKIRGAYVGTYDAMSCPVCRYYYFTDDAYDLAWQDARYLGLVGIPSPPRILPVYAFQQISSGTGSRTSFFMFDESAKELLEHHFKQDGRGRSDNNSEPSGVDFIHPVLVTECISVGEQQRR